MQIQLKSFLRLSQRDLYKNSFESKEWDDGGALGCSCGRILI
jgi:hypothetical protein